VAWWLVRDVPRNGDADFREEQLVARANELADGLGNLINRTITFVGRNRPNGIRPSQVVVEEAAPLHTACEELPARIDAALTRFGIRGAADAIWETVVLANRFVSTTAPWELAKAEERGESSAGRRLDAVLTALLDACLVICDELAPFLPSAAARIGVALTDLDPTLGRQLFAKAEVKA
jgi:methionyl-tRNA synthetase